MNQAHLKEATAILQALLTAIGAASVDRTSSTAGSLREAIGVLNAGAAAAIASFSFGAPLVEIFSLLRRAGASFAAADAIRAQALASGAVSAFAGVIADAVMLQALVCQCRIVADMTFTSRDQVDTIRDRLDAAFDGAVDGAAGAFDQVTVRTLVTLRAAVMRDLTARARPLPQIINYIFPRRCSALWLAQRLYADGSRYFDLVDENSVVHPLFMPASGRALSR